MDQPTDCNYPSDNNSNPGDTTRPANPYLRPKEAAPEPASDVTRDANGQSALPKGNSFGDYVPSWPAPGTTTANASQNPYLRNSDPSQGSEQAPASNPYQSPYSNPYQSATPQPEPAYKTSGSSYSYTSSYAPNQQTAAANQPRRVIMGGVTTNAKDPGWTRIILGIIVLFFVGQLVTGGFDIMGNSIDPVEQWGMLTWQGVAGGEWWRLITSMFLHAGILHILFNGLALYALGMQVEALMGGKRFLLIFFLTGIGGNVLTLLVNPVPSVGASGGIFGLLGALIAFFYRNQDRLGAWGKANLRSLLITAGINFLITFSIPQVNQMAHVGGLVTGLFLGYFLSPWQVKKTIGAGTQAVNYRLQDWAMAWWSVPALVVLELVLLYFSLQQNGPIYRFR